MGIVFEDPLSDAFFKEKFQRDYEKWCEAEKSMFTTRNTGDIKMEKFEGTLYECLGKYIDNGGKGYIKNAKGVKACIELMDDKFTDPCTYIPPEPVWVETEPWCAYRDVCEGKPAQAATRDGKREWEYIDLVSHIWNFPGESVFRVRQR